MKSVVEAVLVRGGATNLVRRFHRSRKIVLAYHNVVPHGEPISGDRSLHITQEQFAAQLDQLVAYCNVVPLHTLFERPDHGRRPTVAITFDDAYRGAVTVGVRELASHSLSATIFVIPGLVGGGPFWWDDVLPTAEQRGDDFRQKAIGELGGIDTKIRDWAKTQGISPVNPPEHAMVATEAELHEAASEPGITLGSHTWSHPNLTRLDTGAVERELKRSMEWLRQRFACAVPWLTYPYGLSSPVVEQIASATGYRGALRVTGGWIAKTTPTAFALPRLNVPAGVSPHGFELRLSGIVAR